ncbi:alpha/beta fold hydrolase [Modicisalibacter xianhensis]|uniref:Pimeloyl-ACP methyl ester carboxylesterase n=1 Tax=Modicisalibacter xianhensis TaxID=442341 RepID=A0A1I3G0Q6_9GAMM|nr:alpha/beta hydrolase [Halomonas xianhensis]SFI16741.1 Pimeloyl-ACP methyl ester carboxylesterase [Halomonas xianhensis]
MDNSRSRKSSGLGRLALWGTVAWFAYAAYQKRQTLKARRSGTDDMPVAPALSRSALVEGILMRWEEHGERSPGKLPIVMVHGIPTNPRLWRYVIPQLEETGTPRLAWEMVGYGYSIDEGLGRAISIPAQAEYLQLWLEAQGIERAVFVGHDVGGGVLQALLAAHPERFAGLVLVDSVAFDNWPVPMMKLVQQSHSLVDMLPPGVLKPLFHTGIRDLGHDDAGRGEESAALLWEPYSRPTGPAGFANQARYLHAADTMEAATRLATRPELPVRIVWGEKDPLSVDSAQRLAMLLGAPGVEVIPGARHFNPEDHPDIVAEAIRQVLANVTGSPPRLP